MNEYLILMHDLHSITMIDDPKSHVSVSNMHSSMIIDDEWMIDKSMSIIMITDKWIIYIDT
jgi:hypothetical protein